MAGRPDCWGLVDEYEPHHPICSDCNWKESCRNQVRLKTVTGSAKKKAGSKAKSSYETPHSDNLDRMPGDNEHPIVRLIMNIVGSLFRGFGWETFAFFGEYRIPTPNNWGAKKETAPSQEKEPKSGTG